MQPQSFNEPRVPAGYLGRVDSIRLNQSMVVLTALHASSVPSASPYARSFDQGSDVGNLGPGVSGDRGCSVGAALQFYRASDPCPVLLDRNAAGPADLVGRQEEVAPGFGGDGAVDGARTGPRPPLWG